MTGKSHSTNQPREEEKGPTAGEALAVRCAELSTDHRISSSITLAVRRGPPPRDAVLPELTQLEVVKMTQTWSVSPRTSTVTSPQTVGKSQTP